MSIELTLSEKRETKYALIGSLASLTRVERHEVTRDHVQRNVEIFDTASALAKIDPEAFGPREIGAGDTVKIINGFGLHGKSAQVLGRGKGCYASQVAVEVEDGRLTLLPASDLEVIA